MKAAIAILLLAAPGICAAQYRGGTNDGLAQGSASLQNPIPGIFIGGSNDGHSAALASNQNALPSIYIGGINDGQAIATALTLNPLPNMYLGGVNDGVAIGQATGQNINPTIYLGGVNDGMASIQGTNQNPLPNIYGGGENDGHSIAAAPASQNPLPAIYTGGPNDGFTIAVALSQNSSFPLPLHLLEFAGSWFNEDAILAWRTGDERGLDHFELERSEQGSDFHYIASIAPGSNSAGNDYRFPDNGAYELPAEALFYRLKLVDQQGRYSYSAIVKLSKNKAAPVIAAYPNPTRGRVTLALLNVQSFEAFSYLLSDNNGRVLQRGQITKTHTDLDLGQYAAGAYHLSIFQAGNLFQHFSIILTP